MTPSAPSRSLLHLRRDERGVAAVTVAIALPLLLAFGALAINSGLWFTIKRENQSAADAAAISAAYELMAGPANACTNPGFVTDRLTPAATQAVAANQHVGWDSSGTTTTVICPYPDSLLDTEFGARNYSAVAVTLQQDQSSLFAFAPLASATIATKSVGVVANGASVCILALGAAASRSGPCPAGFGICINGSANSINAPGCAVVADSTASNAIDLVGGGGGNLINAAAIQTPGGTAGSGANNTAPPVQTFSIPVTDPYASTLTHTALTSGFAGFPDCLRPPPGGTTYGGDCKVPAGWLGQPSIVLKANTQIDGTWTVLGTVDLKPGTYWVTDGDLNVSGTLECTGCTGGAGVTIILTTAGTCPATVGTVNFAPGNNSTSLNAPTSGTFKGDLIVQDVNGVPGCTTYTSTPTNLIGTVSTSFTGLVYLPHAEMNIFGNPNLGKAGCLVLTRISHSE